MKTHLTTVLAAGLVYAPLANAANATAVVTAERVSVFKAPLVCPAAPQIGCGSASKPILLDLEKQPGVLEAWLNRAGTIIAVVWKSDAKAEDRRNVVRGWFAGSKPSHHWPKTKLKDCNALSRKRCARI